MSDFGVEKPGAGGYCEVGKDEEEGLNATELGILKVGINKMIVNCYADIQRQSLEKLSDKLDRMIDEANKQGE